MSLLLALLAAAQQPCPKVAPPPAELAGWTKRRPVTAALTPAALDNAAVRPGEAAVVMLAPVGTLRFAADPARKPPSPSRGGLVAVEVPAAGNYRVALSAGAWIDVVQDGALVASAAHGHGPACSGIAKMVDFRLKPGRAVVQLSGTAEPKVTLLVAPVN